MFRIIKIVLTHCKAFSKHREAYKRNKNHSKAILHRENMLINILGYFLQVLFLFLYFVKWGHTLKIVADFTLFFIQCSVVSIFPCKPRIENMILLALSWVSKVQSMFQTQTITCFPRAHELKSSCCLEITYFEKKNQTNNNISGHMNILWNSNFSGHQ